jgi:hypothetical protein
MNISLKFISVFFVILLIILHCSTPSESENNPPLIQSLTANPDSLGVKETSLLTCMASDPDGDELTYTWSAEVGSPTGSGPSVTWLSPDSAGRFSISCKVEDSQGSNDMASVSIQVTDATISIIGEWQSATSLASGRAAHSCVVANGYIYVIGGTDGSNQYDLDDVLYTSINRDGTLYNWQSTTSFPKGRSNHTSIIHNGRLYLIGGWDPVVRYSEVNRNGTLGTWDSTVALTEGRLAHSTVVYNNFVYVLGGYTKAFETGLNDVLFSEINPDGTLIDWQTTASFQNARFDHGSVIHNSIIYIIGGENRTTQFDDIQYATLNPDGTIGQWKSTRSLPAAKTAHTCFVFNDKLFVTGGTSNDIIYAAINSDGTLGQWQTSASSYQNTRGNHTSVIYEDFLYIIGGRSGQIYLNDVQFARLTASGQE